MADWVLIPCLKALFAEFDKIAPSRDHASDGSIGDTAHQNEVSDHNPDETGNVPIHDADHINEVHAIDVDNNLNASFDMEDVIQYFVQEVRKNNPNGTDKGRLRYFIYNERIWKASTGWKQERYTGASPHKEHAHFSAEYVTEYENDTSSWGLVERFGDMALDPAKDQEAFTKMLSQSLSDIKIEDYADPNTPNRTVSWRGWIGYSDSRRDVSNLTQLCKDMGGQITNLQKQVSDLTAMINSHISGLLEGEKNES